MAMPSIACLGVIGKNNNPLHIAVFPSHLPSASVAYGPIRTPLQFSLLVSSVLDIFEARTRANAATGAGLSGDFGLLQALDERLAIYGFETNTGVKFVAVVDARGRSLDGLDGAVPDAAGPSARVATGRARAVGGQAAAAGMVGLREGEMKIVFRAIQTAYVRLLQNPFYDPDEHSPAMGRGGKKIKSPRFAADMQRVGETWMPGKTSL